MTKVEVMSNKALEFVKMALEQGKNDVALTIVNDIIQSAENHITALRSLVREMGVIIEHTYIEIGEGHRKPQYRAIDLLPKALTVKLAEILSRKEVKAIIGEKPNDNPAKATA